MGRHGPICPGTVVVHRYGAVTCTSDFCGWRLPPGARLGRHRQVLRCDDLTAACPHCHFEADGRLTCPSALGCQL